MSITCTGFALGFAYLTCMQPAPPPDTYCQIAKPIYWSKQDTRATKEQADRENRKWKRLCKTK